MERRPRWTAFPALFTWIFALTACSPPPPDPVAAPAATPTESPSAAPAEPVAAPPVADAALPQPLDDAARGEPLQSAADCNLEAVGGQAFAAGGSDPALTAGAKISGWIRDVNGVQMESPALRFENADKSAVWEVAVTRRVQRQDVDPADASSGFEVAVSPGAMPAGRYHAYLTYRSGGQRFACDNGRFVVIR